MSKSSDADDALAIPAGMGPTALVDWTLGEGLLTRRAAKRGTRRKREAPLGERRLLLGLLAAEFERGGRDAERAVKAVTKRLAKEEVGLDPVTAAWLLSIAVQFLRIWLEWRKTR